MNYWLLILSFILSLVLCPVVIAVCKKFNWYDEVDPRKVHTGNIPRMGGVAVFVSFFVVFISAVILSKGIKVWEFAPLIAGGVVIFVAGTLDDFVNLHARVKFAIQVCAAICGAFGPCYLTSVFGFAVPYLVGKGLTCFWILLLVNAYNLIDGLDWLCGGISFLSLCTIGLIYRTEETMFWCFVAFSLASALLGFLFWNKPKAKIFLGDGGSQSLGYFIALLPLLPVKNDSFEFSKFLVCILLASIPTIDVLAAIIRRIRDHRSLFSADRAHLHHKLLNIGFSKVGAVAVLLFLQFIICAMIMLAIMFRIRIGLFSLACAYSFVILFFVVIHYVNRAVNKRNKGLLEDHPQKEH